MRFINRLLVVGLVSMLAVSTANADTLSTPFVATTTGGVGGANYFDATTNTNLVRVTSMQIHTQGILPFTDVQIWLLAGLTSQGNEINGSPWVQVATGSGTGAGGGTPTDVTLSNSFDLAPNTLYGVAVVADPNGDMDLIYNNSGMTENYFDANLSLDLGSAGNPPFDPLSTIFVPRIWNGSITYVVPEPSAMLGLGVIGLVGLVRRRR